MSEETPSPKTPDDVGSPYDHDPRSSTLRVLFYDLWFRIAAALFLLVFIFLGLFLPKIWRTTPPDFIPIIRISGLDKLQAWSLRRTAERLGAEGKYAEAMIAWQSAMRNNPGDPELIRGNVRALIAAPLPSRESLGYGVERLFWLFRLTHTNTADLALSVRFLHRWDLDDMLLQLVEGRIAQLPPEVNPDLLAAYFNQGRMEQFRQLWQSHEPEFSQSPALRLYYAAWQAAWGPPITLQAGRTALDAAQTHPNPELTLLAHQLKLRVSSVLGDLESYKTALAWLEEHHADRVGDHVGLWQLLLVSGRRGEAQALARAFSRPAESAPDALGLAGMFAQLGLDEYSIEFVERQLREFGYYYRLWLGLARQHIHLKQWPELRALAVRMRNSPDLRGQLDGYSQYITGVADQKTGRAENAAAAFAKLPGAQFPEPLLAFSVATELLRLGYPDISSKILQNLETSFADKASFWFELTSAAYEARDMEVLGTAARKAWELDPKRTDFINNYAAVLIVLRQKPEQSAKLTLNLVAREPNRVEFRLNHALALLQNGRLDEAEAILKVLNPARMNFTESAVATYAWLEFHIHRSNWPALRELYPKLARSQFLQPQLDWLDAEYKKLEAIAGK